MQPHTLHPSRYRLCMCSNEMSTTKSPRRFHWIDVKLSTQIPTTSRAVSGIWEKAWSPYPSPPKSCHWMVPKAALSFLIPLRPLLASYAGKPLNESHKFSVNNSKIALKKIKINGVTCFPKTGTGRNTIWMRHTECTRRFARQRTHA